MCLSLNLALQMRRRALERRPEPAVSLRSQAAAKRSRESLTFGVTGFCALLLTYVLVVSCYTACHHAFPCLV